MLEHKHLMVSADYLRDVFSTSWYETWMSGLIEDLDMTPLVTPKAVRDKTKGNEGVTAFSIITTSHIVLHTWETTMPYKLQLDVYSCSDLDKKIVFKHIEQFEPKEIDYVTIDRNKAITINTTS